MFIPAVHYKVICIVFDEISIGWAAITPIQGRHHSNLKLQVLMENLNIYISITAVMLMTRMMFPIIGKAAGGGVLS